MTNCNFRVGMGYDVHQLVPDRDLWLGGIKIPHTLGLLGHSDADVLIHAICDALLHKVIELLARKGYHVGNIDATVCAERPKINPHVDEMRTCLAGVIGCDVDQISIKATTTEKLGFTGREEGISAYAVALIYKD